MRAITARAITASTIVIAFVFLAIASFMNFGVAAAQTGCGIQPLTSNIVQASWTSDCPAQNRENSYGRLYSLRLTEPAEVTITLESKTDPYLFLHTEQGEFVAENDDINLGGGNYNSRISANLAAGSYTIEATTYDKLATGDFTLTVESDSIGEPTPPTQRRAQRHHQRPLPLPIIPSPKAAYYRASAAPTLPPMTLGRATACRKIEWRMASTTRSSLASL